MINMKIKKTKERTLRKPRPLFRQNPHVVYVVAAAGQIFHGDTHKYEILDDVTPLKVFKVHGAAMLHCGILNEADFTINDPREFEFFSNVPNATKELKRLGRMEFWKQYGVPLHTVQEVPFEHHG